MNTLKSRKSRGILLRTALLTGFCLSLLCGCHQAKKGCLDNNAVNYDVSADRNCCCKYPELTINTSLQWDGSPFDWDSVYVLGSGQAFKLVDMNILLNNFALKRANTRLRSDSIARFTTTGGMELNIPDDFAWWSGKQSAVSIPEFIVKSTYDSLAFQIGLSHPDIDPEVLDPSHPLHPDNSGWNPALGFPVLSMKWLTGVHSEDTVGVRYTTIREKEVISMSLPRKIEGVIGQNTTVDISLDLAKCLEHVDLQHPDSAEVLKRLKGAIE